MPLARVPGQFCTPSLTNSMVGEGVCILIATPPGTPSCRTDGEDMAPTKRADAGGRREPERRTRATPIKHGRRAGQLQGRVRTQRANQITLDSAALSDMDKSAVDHTARR
jgi:hypothetical protein